MTQSTCEGPEFPDSKVINTADNDNAGQGSENTINEKEIGGRAGLDPTRYGDWEKNGRCIDF